MLERLGSHPVDDDPERLQARRTDPLKQLKVSALDAEAQKRWKDYTKARDEMLSRTHTAWAPWTCVANDHKKAGRLNLIRHMVRTVAPKPIAEAVAIPDQAVVFGFEIEALKDGRLHR